MLLDDSALPKARIADSLKRKCTGVVDIPDRDLGTREAARLWAQDRSNFGACARRHNALVDSVKALEK